MGIFDAAPSYRVASPAEGAQVALNLPLTPLNNLWQQAQQGAADSFGLGTAIKDFETPRGNLPLPTPLEAGVTAAQTLVSPLTIATRGLYEGARAIFGAKDSGVAMSSDEYKTSEFYRKDIPWDPSMTQDRAAALATNYDLRQARSYFGQKDMLTTIAGGFLGGALDPINYVPVFGPAARAAAAARFGTIIGHGLIGASEAAINTAVFGVLTAPDRAKYGEDVSWEASINNIAFSAVAGGIFGALGGAVERARNLRTIVADRNIRMGAETIQNTIDARDVLNDAVTSLVTTGDPALSPKSESILQRIAANVTDKRDAVRALDRETSAVAGTKAGEVAIAPSGARVAVRPEIVELSSLAPATGDLQVRNRTPDNAASVAQIEDIAINLDPARLMPNVDASQGSPIVGPDGVVDSGNGRVAAIARAYDAYPERAAAYRQALVDAGYPDAATMQNPVLVSRRTTDLSPAARAQFNADVNGPTTARLSAVELAAMDRNALTDSVMAAHDNEAPITAASNRGFVARFLGELPQNERNSLVDPQGNLSADGVRRIENALVAAAYGDVDAGALRKFAEATDDNTRSIVGALADVAGKWVNMRRAILRGEISPDYDVTPELTEALRKLSTWRDQAAREKRPVGTVIKEGMAQGDMLSGSMPIATKLFVRSFYQNADFTVAAGRETIAARLSDLVKAAQELGQPDMLGDAYAATKEGVLQNVYGDIGGDIFEAPNVRTGADGFLPAGVESSPGGSEPGNLGGTGENGRSAGSAGDNAAATDGLAVYHTPEEQAAVKAATVDLKARQPARSFDEIYAVAPGHQDNLNALGRELDGGGIVYKAASVKKRETAEAKMVRKSYKSTSELTDIVRGGFIVKTPQDAEKVVAAIKARFGEVVDEGWWMNGEGYFDRKLLVRFEDGTIGEVQFWHPDLLEAKDGAGHKLYEQQRGLAPDDPKFLELRQQQRDLYLGAVRSTGEDWLPILSAMTSDLGDGLPTLGKTLSKAASESGLPESRTSAASTLDQAVSPDSTAQAELPLNTAGLDSQSKNSSFMSGNVGRPVVDMQEPKPEPPPEGLDAAAGRVGKGEDLHALAEQFGVDPKTGDFAELADIEAMRADGRLTEEDLAALDLADQTAADADAYAETLRAAAACVMG